jgi:two-component system probable response regulator PhcQ
MAAINRAEVFRYVAKPWSAEELGQVFALAFERHAATLAASRLSQQPAAGAPALSAQDLEARRLESQEPGITQVRRASDGSVYLD